MKLQKISLAFSFFVLIFFFGCSSTPELISTTGNNIVIDGNDSDWGANLKYLPDEKVAVGVSNDDNYFYLCLTTSDLSKVMPMFGAGFTVWLENEKNDSTLGIRYPLHNIVNEARVMTNPEAVREKGRGMLLKKLMSDQDEIRILNKDNFPVTAISTSDSSGITARIGYNNDQFVYELRVPLNNNDNNKYCLSAIPGEKLSVKFETEKPERKNFGGRRGGGMMGQGGMGREFGGGGYRGGNPEGGERMSFEPIDFSVEVTLK
jgi:hypothetical protein